MLQMNKLLYPTDFSHHSNLALPYAIQLAAIYGAKLCILHVITLFEHDPYDPEHTFPDISTYRSKVEEIVQERTGQVVEHANNAPGEFDVEKLVERGTAPYETILDVAERESVDLIVIPTHGRSGLSHFLLGSVAEKVVRFAGCPVLVVKPDQRELTDPDTKLLHLKKILAPIDFSEPCKAALGYATALAEQFGATLHLAHVIEARINPGYFAAGVDSVFDINPDLKARVEQQLKDFADREALAGVATEFFVLEGKAHSEIDNHAREEGIDLIVMGTQGYDEIGDYLIGSTTERTVRHAPCPVLVTH